MYLTELMDVGFGLQTQYSTKFWPHLWGVSVVLTGYREMSLRRQESRLAQHNSGAGAGSNSRSLIPSGVFWAYLSTAPFGENYSGDD